jgi:hypothetical protein
VKSKIKRMEFGEGFLATAAHKKERRAKEWENKRSAYFTFIMKSLQYNDINPSGKALPSNPNHLWKVPPLNTDTLGIKFLMHEVGETHWMKPRLFQEKILFGNSQYLKMK